MANANRQLTAMTSGAFDPGETQAEESLPITTMRQMKSRCLVAPALSPPSVDSSQLSEASVISAFRLRRPTETSSLPTFVPSTSASGLPLSFNCSLSPVFVFLLRVHFGATAGALAAARPLSLARLLVSWLWCVGVQHHPTPATEPPIHGDRR